MKPLDSDKRILLPRAWARRCRLLPKHAILLSLRGLFSAAQLLLMQHGRLQRVTQVRLNVPRWALPTIRLGADNSMRCQRVDVLQRLLHIEEACPQPLQCRRVRQGALRHLAHPRTSRFKRGPVSVLSALQLPAYTKNGRTETASRCRCPLVLPPAALAPCHQHSLDLISACSVSRLQQRVNRLLQACVHTSPPHQLQRQGSQPLRHRSQSFWVLHHWATPASTSLRLHNTRLWLTF